MASKPKVGAKRRKAVTKDDSIRLRCTEEQKALLTEAATREGQGLSGWLLRLGLVEARRIVQGSG